MKPPCACISRTRRSRSAATGELNPGFAPKASAACTEHGFEVRNCTKVGRHAAAYHQGAWSSDHFSPPPTPWQQHPAPGCSVPRVQALRRWRGCAHGRDPGVRPGNSVRAASRPTGGGRIKLVGTAQRVVTGGWWFNTGIVVSDSAPLRAVTADVYQYSAWTWTPPRWRRRTRTTALLTEDLEGAIVEVYAQTVFTRLFYF